VTIDRKTLEEIVAELKPLVGARIQRVHVVADQELVLELRVPKRTVRLLLSARSGLGRIHVVESRPPRLLSNADLQSRLRRALEGEILLDIEAREDTAVVHTPRVRLEVRIKGGKDAIALIREPSHRPEPSFDREEPLEFLRSAALAAQYGARSEVDETRSLRADLLRPLSVREKKLGRLVQNLARDRERLHSMAADKRLGERLKTELSSIRRGQTEHRVKDWETGEELAIPLDPALSPKQNMERLFQRAKKAERGGPIVERRAREVEAEIQRVRREKERVQTADLAQLAEAMTEELEKKPTRVSSHSKKKDIDRCSRRFEAGDGSEIRVGKGAKENDRLTLAFAKGDDVWLHASGTSGAHVLLRVDKGKEPSPEALADAALLAAHYSGAKSASKVEVVYTQARYVKKTKGDPPGRVSVAKGRTLLVTVDTARLDRLFGRTS
jgi:predicted ribosome quality control (RQC) complex YloA/Tae2 family protein